MTVSVEGQALSLGVGLLLGMGIGLCYDLLRVLRSRISRGGWTALLDGLFWTVVTAVLFGYAQATEGGRVRIYLALALFGGSALYFRLFCRFVLRAGYHLADLIGRVFRLLLIPARIFLRFGKKILKNIKNLFLSCLQWYKI